MRRGGSRVEEGLRSVGRAARSASATDLRGCRGFGAPAPAADPGAEPGGYRWPQWFWAVLPIAAACLWLASAS